MSKKDNDWLTGLPKCVTLAKHASYFTIWTLIGCSQEKHMDHFYEKKKFNKIWKKRKAKRETSYLNSEGI